MIELLAALDTDLPSNPTTDQQADPAALLDVRVAELTEAGIRRIHVFAWRDLDDDDAGGSEVHADEFMRRWASRGLDVVHRTSFAVGRPTAATRNGYRVIRKGSRYSVFPRTIISELAGRMGHSDAVVEVWNGVPWFSPVWYRRPQITFLHHVHGPMWNQILPGPLAQVGRLLESRLAPPLYRHGLTVTPSASTRDELLELGFRPERVIAVPNGVDPRFAPRRLAVVPAPGQTGFAPGLVAVGRLAPVKRFDALIDAAVVARRRIPNLTLTIVGEGPLRSDLDAQIESLGAHDWITLTGHVDDARLIELYQTSSLVVSASLAEGWGLSLTEAAACGVPAVATDIRGHQSSVVDGVTGVLAPLDRLGDAIADVLLDDTRRQQLATAARQRSMGLTWDASALGITDALSQAVAQHGAGRGDVAGGAQSRVGSSVRPSVRSSVGSSVRRGVRRGQQR